MQFEIWRSSAFVLCMLRLDQALLLGFLLVICSPWLAQNAAAQAPGTAELDGIRNSFADIEALRTDLDDIREWQRDGLNRRIDGLGLDALDRLNSAAPRFLEDAPETTRQSLIKLLDDAAKLGLERADVLEQRAAAERALLPKFAQSAEADIARAFMEDLGLIRDQYLDALVDQLDVRRAAGLE